MNKKVLVSLALACMVAATGCGGDAGKTADKNATVQIPANEKITVSAAASLKEALNEITVNYVAERHIKADQIAITYAGSGTLRQQIEQGAPSSIFISANEDNMKQLQDKGVMDGVKPWTKNALVLIVPAGKEQIKIDQLANASKIAIGTPETVPAGKYAKTMLEKLGTWNAVESKIVYAKDVRAVLNYVMEGAVDAGFVYKTDAMQGKDKVVITDTAPTGSIKDVVYPIGLIKANQNTLSKDFYEYLNSEASQKVMEKYGFAGVMY